jgi:hypothetical protein
MINNNQPEPIKNEDRIYISPYSPDPLFDIPYAGISYPNPQYKKRRDNLRAILNEE